MLIAGLPVRAIWKLQIPRRQRLALMGVLTIGWLYVYSNLIHTVMLTAVTSVCVISMARLHGFIELSKHPDDSTFYGAAPAYWSAIEVNLGMYVCQ